MSRPDLLNDASQFLEAMNFAARADALKHEHRDETARMLIHFLRVLDHLRALESRCRELDAQGHAQVPISAVGMIREHMEAVFLEWGVRPVATVGSRLDLIWHEVISVQPAETEPDLVVEEVLRGYAWHGDLLRRAQVIVAGNRATCELPRGEDQQ